MSNPTSTIMTAMTVITPQQAKDWLESNTHNQKETTMLTPHADLTEILEMAADNQLSPQATADLIIAEGWVTIHHSIAAQTVSWAASQAEEVISTGTHAEATQPTVGDSPALHAIARKELLQDMPHVWMEQLATELGSTNWNI